MKTIFSVPCFLVGLIVAGCGSQQQNGRGFFTSGSREADQRADQRMAGVEQLHDSNGKAQPAGEAPTTLFERLGGERGITLIVDDFVGRVLEDPRVNFERKGVTQGGILRHTAVTWDANPQNVEQLKKHFVQFFELSTGGPSFFDGKSMKDAHNGMKITNAEFDAAIGDLKATLDKLQIPDKEQRELISVVESTRTQIVEER